MKVSSLAWITFSVITKPGHWICKIYFRFSWSACCNTMSFSSSEILVEGVLMFLVAIIGIILNIVSVVYFAQLKHQRAFHRWQKCCCYLFIWYEGVQAAVNPGCDGHLPPDQLGPHLLHSQPELHLCQPYLALHCALQSSSSTGIR